MPFRPVGNILKRRLEHLQRLQYGSTEAGGVVARFAGGAGARIEYRSEERVMIITANTKTAASELALQEFQIKRAINDAGVPVDRIIIR